jgi:hypothetical protein
MRNRRLWTNGPLVSPMFSCDMALLVTSHLVRRGDRRFWWMSCLRQRESFFRQEVFGSSTHPPSAAPDFRGCVLLSAGKATKPDYYVIPPRHEGVVPARVELLIAGDEVWNHNNSF